MLNQKKISRRAFVFGLSFGGICEAATPLINLNQKQPSLINFSRNRNFFNSSEESHWKDSKGFYFDPEPELLNYGQKTSNEIKTFHYKPKRNFNLKMVNANTEEQILIKIRLASLNYGINYQLLDYFLRDWRENKVTQMNKQIIDILLKICESSLGLNDSLTVQITSGYRTKKTNSYLRKLSKNVAKNSLHMKGQAIDFAILGVAEKQLKNIAKEHAIGGLGLYNNFMHIDSGPFRRWVS
tara:strand:- start:118 stop:837 length:720 start_codon:yes stop_codon:yes gene_type:complete